MKVTKLDWQVTAAMEHILADMQFDNFDQSMRFMNLLINFLREEKALAEASHTPEATLGQNDFAEQGKISGAASQSGGADGQRAEQADTGSVTC